MVDAGTSCSDEDFPVDEDKKSTTEPSSAAPHETKDESITAAMFDSDVTLQFLKSAVFYFLTDRENYANHLRAIQSILNFDAREKKKIEQSFHGLY
jgi:hypothetical protein